MKVIHRSDALLILEDRPWLIGVLMVGMVLVFLFGAMALLSSGEIFGGLMLGGIGVGVPLLIGALMVQRVRLTLDRQAGSLTRTCRSVRGLTQERHALDRLVEAFVDTSRDGDGTTYRMDLRLKDPKETLPFASYHTSGQTPAQMARAVNDWLARLG